MINTLAIKWFLFTPVVRLVIFYFETSTPSQAKLSPGLISIWKNIKSPWAEGCNNTLTKKNIYKLPTNIFGINIQLWDVYSTNNPFLKKIYNLNQKMLVNKIVVG